MQPKWGNIIAFLIIIFGLVFLARLPDEVWIPPFPPDFFIPFIWACIIGLVLGVLIRIARRI